MRLLGGGQCRVDALAHAAAVVAVARDRVQPPQVVRVPVQHVAGGAQGVDGHLRDLGRRAGRGGGGPVPAARGRGGSAVVGGSSASRRGSCGSSGRAPRRKAGVSAGASHSRSSSSSSQVRVREQPAMSRLVTSSPTSGRTGVEPGLVQQPGHGAPQHVQLLVLGGAEAVEDDGDAPAVARVGGPFGQQPGPPARGPAPRPCPARPRSTPGSPWMPRPEAETPSGTVNSGCSPPGQGAAVEGHAEGAGAGVGVLGDADDLAPARRPPRPPPSGLEDDEAARDAAAPRRLVRRARRRCRR